MRRYNIPVFAVFLLLSLAYSCKRTTAPKECDWITKRGLHEDTTHMVCK